MSVILCAAYITKVIMNKEISQTNIPSHLAFIMDGNGRWAKSRLLPRKAGHLAGVNAVEKLIENCIKLNIKYVTLYAFSTENWKRSPEEIDALFNIFRDFFKKCKNKYKDKDIKLNILGDISKFPIDMQQSINETLEDTKDCKLLTVSIAFNYGAIDEILRAIKLLKDSNKDINEHNFRKYLYTDGIPDPDMIIRTSGEMRLSNFLLFQAAYSELYFTEKFWPDFGYRDLVKAINEYCKRNRRFGAV